MSDEMNYMPVPDEHRGAVVVADKRCQPFLRTWAYRAFTQGGDIRELLRSVYLQGFSDGMNAARSVEE